jgi:DinB superfamily
METFFAQLDGTRSELLQLAGSLDEDKFRKRPSADCWSVAEIINHLCIVERAVLLTLKRNQKTPGEGPGLLARFKPVAFVAFRTFKVKAPDIAVPKHVPPRDELMEMFASSRDDLKAFVSGTSKRELRRLTMKHPILGMINGWAAIKFIHRHEQRHLKQAREVLKRI